MAITLLKDKQTIIKEREGERLARYLRILFGNEKFGFKWSHRETSYTDGTDIYILYELQRPDCRTFTPAELRVLRKHHSVHERGHIEYDVIDDYRKWTEKWMSRDKNEWISNEKYPASWLQYFGNTMLDGRMENFTTIDHPTTKDYFDLGNYDWRFGIRGEHAGEDTIFDFRECFMSRALAMTDIEKWHPDSVALVDSVQYLIEKGRIDVSTQAVLDTTLEIIKIVWPTLLEWMDVQNEEPDNFDYQDDHQGSTWGKQDEVEENVKRVLVKVAVKVKGDGESSSGSESDEKKNDSEEESNDSTTNENDDKDEKEPSKPDFSKVIRLEEKNIEKDDEEAENTLGPYSERKQEVTVWEHREDRKSYTSTVEIKPFDEMNLKQYSQTYQEIKKYVKPTAKALSELLEPIADEERRNQRSGKLKVNKVWRTEILSDANVFDKRKKGTPGKNARILILNDVSGSTSSDFPGTKDRIIDQMKKAQTLLIESCEAANVPVASYGFTEDNESTIIYPFKPYGRFTATEKGFIGGIDSRWGNRDTLALQWAVDELATYPEDVRLIIMLSDGEPCFSNGETYDTMRSIVQQAEKRGIDILCLYVGPQYSDVIDRVHYMYPGKSIVVSKHLSRELSRHVKRVIRKRR